MSSFLIGAILTLCPGHDTDHKGQIITNVCQEWMTNCMINEAGNEEPTKKHFAECASRRASKIGSGNKDVPSDIEQD